MINPNYEIDGGFFLFSAVLYLGSKPYDYLVHVYFKNNHYNASIH